MPRGYRNYTDGLNEALSLSDPSEAAEYLNACLAGGSGDVFLMALRQFAAAHGFSGVARRSALGRETLYRTLSEKGNPTLERFFGCWMPRG